MATKAVESPEQTADRFRVGSDAATPLYPLHLGSNHLFCVSTPRQAAKFLITVANSEVGLVFIYIWLRYSHTKQLKMERIYLQITTCIILKTEVGLPCY